jgi:hypothetical protein
MTVDEMIHGTPSQPVTDDGPIDQDGQDPIPWWLYLVGIAIMIIITIMFELAFPGLHDYDGGNLTR